MIILQLQEKLPNNLNVNHSIVVQHLKQTRRVKKLDKWVPHELMTNQKNHHFGVSSLILHNSEPFLGLRCVTKRISYDNQWWAAQWLDKETLKHFPKPNLHQKKSHGHFLVVCCQSDPLQLSESQQNHYTWEACSANRWDALKTAMPAAGTGQQNAGHTTSGSKIGWIGLRSFVSSAIFTWPLANQLPLQVTRQLFAGKTLPQPAGCRK